MKKNLIISASASVLMSLSALASPIVMNVAHASTDSAITLSAGNAALFKQTNNGIKIEVTNAKELKPNASIDTIETQITPDAGNASLASNGSAFVVPSSKADSIKSVAEAKADAVSTLQGGKSYRIVAFNVQVSDLDKDQSYNFNGKTLKPDANGKIVLDHVTSDNFVVVDHSKNIQPYFTQVTDNGKSTTAIPNGGTANTVSTANISTADDVLKAAKNAVGAHAGTNAGESSYVYTTTLDDIKKQLTDQNIKLADNDSFSAPNGYNIKLTIANNVSGQTASVTIPFGTTAKQSTAASAASTATSSSPIKVNNTLYTIPQTYVVRSNQFKDQNGVNFKDINGNEITFSNVSKASGADFTHPGTYTVTLTGIDKSNTAKSLNDKAVEAIKNMTGTNTSTNNSALQTATYTLIVLPGSDQKVYTNGDDSVPTYSIEDGKVTETKTTLKDKADVKVAGNTKNIDGVSYTEIETNGKKLYIRTTSLTDFTKNDKLGTATKRTVMHASYVYDKKGKRANKSDIKAYSALTTYGQSVTINRKKFYRISKDHYVKANNLTGIVRKVTSKNNAVVYNGKGNAVTYKHRILAIKPGQTVTTYGSNFKIGRSKVPVYRIAKGQYVKASDLKL